jgi:S1-C subfamily serine protease
MNQDNPALIALLIIALVLAVPFAILVAVNQSDKKKRMLRESGLREKLAASVGGVAPVNPFILIELGDIALAQDKADEAIDYYREAAKLDSADGCKRLSDIYWGRHEYKQYFEYELKGAELGNEVAMRNVSACYKMGKGVLKNIGKSTYWLLRSAESGNMDSMNALAHCYISGFGVRENPMEGLAWLYVAEHKNSIEAAGRIKSAEASLNNALILLAQDRAKVLLDLIQDGHRTSYASFANVPGVTTPGHQERQKPKHAAKGSGSGAVISPLGHVATAAHVIKGAAYLEVITPEGTFPATVLSSDEQNDVALLKVEQAFTSHIQVGRSSEVRLGQSVATIGFPNIGIQGHSPKVTQGMISGENGIQNDIRMWQISVPIQPGNSGGPLLDDKGRMIGVVVASLSLRAIQMTGSVPQNVNYAIKGAYLEPLLNFHKLSADESTNLMPASFQDMIATAQKSTVLILVY